ncbi:hypothetical protein KBD18_00985 [Patescibacteria group bacterium]|nr:hypothetical protein [Patescibacteria group bacterium]
MKKLQGGSPELFQWTIIAFTVLIVATLTVNAIRLQTATRELARKVDALETGIGGEKQMMPPQGVPVSPAEVVANSNANENTNIPAAGTLVAPNVVTIPGTKASITLPGAWKQTQNSGYLSFSIAPNADLNITRMNIGDQDLQQWFLKQYPLNDAFATQAVADANAAGMHVTRADIRIFGPNQVLVVGNLSMDATVSYQKQFSEENPLIQTQRFVAVRRGGDVIVFEVSVLTADADAVLATFDQVLQTLSFAS